MSFLVSKVDCRDQGQASTGPKDAGSEVKVES